MREDTTAEVAALSGGEQFRFRDEQELERNLSIVARDIRNGYTLNFYPSSHEAGFHAITVQVVPQSPHLEVNRVRAIGLMERLREMRMLVFFPRSGCGEHSVAVVKSPSHAI